MRTYGNWSTNTEVSVWRKMRKWLSGFHFLTLFIFQIINKSILCLPSSLYEHNYFNHLYLAWGVQNFLPEFQSSVEMLRCVSLLKGWNGFCTKYKNGQYYYREMLSVEEAEVNAEYRNGNRTNNVSIARRLLYADSSKQKRN